jgi:hypothetical protein
MASAMEPIPIDGAVVEVAVPHGVDTLSVDAAPSARYDSAVGARYEWTVSDGSLLVQVKGLLAAARDAMSEAAPIDPRTLPALRFGEARMLWLTPDGTIGVQGAMVALLAKPCFGALLRQSADLIRALTAHAEKAG